jgi:hypothetical protein
MRTNEGEVVDPTKEQFVSLGLGEYNEIDESTFKDPIGKCPECGEWVWKEGFDGCCSRRCQVSYLAYVDRLNRGIYCEE